MLFSTWKKNRHFMRNCGRERLAAVTFPFTIFHSKLYASIPKLKSRTARISIEYGEEEKMLQFKALRANFIKIEIIAIADKKN